MKQYVGNCSDVIDWNAVVESIKNSEPAYQGPRHTKQDDLPGIKEISESWDKAGYTLASEGGTIGWDMCIPETNFDRSVVDKFADNKYKLDAHTQTELLNFISSVGSGMGRCPKC